MLYVHPENKHRHKYYLEWGCLKEGYYFHSSIYSNKPRITHVVANDKLITTFQGEILPATTQTCTAPWGKFARPLFARKCS